jgi:hypothetical protein
MGRTAHRRFAVAGVFVAATLGLAFVARISGARAQQTSGGLAGSTPVTTLNQGGAGGATDIPDLGSTYYWLEGKALKTVTRFPDAVATAERSGDGDMRSHLADVAGNDIGALIVDRISASSTQLSFTDNADRLNVESRPDLVHTLEWANAQAYTLRKEGRQQLSTLGWKGRFLRPKGSAAESLEDQALETTTEFDNGVVAVTTKNPKDPKGQGTKRPTFITRVTANGAEVGVIKWYEKEKILAWNFPGLSKDVITEDVLKPYGGWKFKPTLAWANVQGLAFYDFHRLMKTQGYVARNCSPRSPGAQLAEMFLPTLHANEAGCDGMHYLDGSIYRPCCDNHDRCYEASGCSSRSWYWPFGSSWSCTFCNMSVIGCFMGAGLGYLDYQNYTW